MNDENDFFGKDPDQMSTRKQDYIEWFSMNYDQYIII
jgi:hypothetical protein